jgi:hypothetical protein
MKVQVLLTRDPVSKGLEISLSTSLGDPETTVRVIILFPVERNKLSQCIQIKYKKIHLTCNVNRDLKGLNMIFLEEYQSTRHNIPLYILGCEAVCFSRSMPTFRHQATSTCKQKAC